jgi:hypothetical protein
MAKLCNAARMFFRAQPAGAGRNFTQYIVTRRLQSLLCCAALASFRLKSATVVDAKQVLTGPSSMNRSCERLLRLMPCVVYPPATGIHGISSGRGGYGRRKPIENPFPAMQFAGRRRRK